MDAHDNSQPLRRPRWMGEPDSRPTAWSLRGEARTRLGELLKDGAGDAPSPGLTEDQAIMALEEIRGAYLKGEELARRRRAPTPANTIKLAERALEALRQLETRADADTVQLVRETVGPLRLALRNRLDELAAWAVARKEELPDSEGRPVRKVDARSERKRVLCGHIAMVWARAAREPGNETNRRRFAIAFLDAAGIDHPGENHPRQLDDWLSTPVNPLSTADHEAAADQARTVLANHPQS